MVKKCRDHLGNSFMSKAEMCKHWGVDRTTFNSRMGRGLTLEQALTGKNMPRIPKDKHIKPKIQEHEKLIYEEYATDHLGNQFNSINEMCKHYRVPVDIYLKRKMSGCSDGEALCRKCPNYCEDHRGVGFVSPQVMLRTWGITEDTFNARRAKGLSLKECLTGEIDERVDKNKEHVKKPHGLIGKTSNSSKKCKDHLGNEFISIEEMCKHWNTNIGTFYCRLRGGYSIETALTGNNLAKKPSTASKKCKDHLGNKFNSVEEMCKHWNINLYTYYQRLRNGYSIEIALTGNRIEDHLGNKFTSIHNMCKYWGIEEQTFHKRIKNGHSLEDALTKDVQTNSIHCADHLGNKFKSVVAMCAYWHVNRATFDLRIKHGWSLEEALLGKKIGKRQSCDVDTHVKDHTGNEFRSLEEMCKYWGLSTKVYTFYKSEGFSVKSILTGDCIKTYKYKAPETVYDHNGNEFSSVYDMVEAWGRNHEEFVADMRLGYSLEEALTGVSYKVQGLNAAVDHTGMEFPCVNAMCKAWGVPFEVFKKRYEYGYGLKSSLTGKGINDSVK